MTNKVVSNTLVVTGLIAVFASGVVGCKSTSQLAWWKASNKADVESSALAHSAAPQLPADVARQAEAASGNTPLYTPPATSPSTATLAGNTQTTAPTGRLPLHWCCSLSTRPGSWGGPWSRIPWSRAEPLQQVVFPRAITPLRAMLQLSTVALPQVVWPQASQPAPTTRTPWLRDSAPRVPPPQQAVACIRPLLLP